MQKLIFLLLFIPVLSFGQVPDPIPNTYINDLTGKLTADQVHNLNESILAIEKKSSVQIAVILLDNLPASMSIEDYSLEVGRKWHVGNAANGLVYVAAISERKQRLEVARALEYQITDMEAQELTNSVKPFFRQQDYYGGINKLLDGISRQLDPVLKEQLALAKKELDKKNEQSSPVFIWLIWLLGSGGTVTVLLLRRRKKAREQQQRERQDDEQKRAELTELIANLNVPPLHTAAPPLYASTSPTRNTITPVIIADDIVRRKQREDQDEREEEERRRRRASDDSNSSFSSSSSSDSSSSSSSSSNDSSYGNWGSGSSDDSSSSSSSSSSDFSGGGSSNDW